MELLPGIKLHCFRDDRFKQGALSIQFVRLMKQEEAALNALLPVVLLRGTQEHPNLQQITWKLDDLYGVYVGTMVRRVGDYQTTGFYCSFMEDRFAFEGDRILEPMIAFAEELLLRPVLEEGVFCDDFVRSEKKNLIAAIESEINDKRFYAQSRLMKLMCRGDSYAVPRLGEKEQVEQIDAKTLYEHYRLVLKESPVEIFYVGSAEGSEVAKLLLGLAQKLGTQRIKLPASKGFCGGEGGHESERMDITQTKLCMGFVTSVTNRDPEFAAMQVMNTLFGAGMTSKLFMNLREKQSLCYSIGSSYHGAKGLMSVAAGIDEKSEQVVRDGVMEQLRACCDGEITDAELEGAKEALLSGLRGIHDSPGSIENYYAAMLLAGLDRTPERYAAQIAAVTAQDVAAAAKTLRYHSSFCLRGGCQ